MIEPRELNQVWRLPMEWLCLVFFLLVVVAGFSPKPLAAQEGYGVYPEAYQPYQKPGQSTTTTKEEKVQPDGTKTVKETMATESQGSRYHYSGLPGKFIKSGGQSRGQGQLSIDREPRRQYSFEFASQGLPKGTNPTETYWFERQDGKIMIIDPRLTQKYGNNPR
jgi:hypothetical protein